MKLSAKVYISGAVIVAASLLAYHGIFSVPFLFDDFNAIALNSTIRHLWPPWDVLLTPQGTGSATEGRPLANLTLAINYALGGTDPWGYHALSLGIHILAALTLFGVLRRTFEKAGIGVPHVGDLHALLPAEKERLAARTCLLAFAAALIWAVHPLLSEAVIIVADRTELLVSLFYLLTLYCFIRYADGEAGMKAWAWLSILCCLLGMASKEVMVSAPVIVLLYDRTFVAGSFPEAWRKRRRLHLGLDGTWVILIVLRIVTPGRGSTGGFGQGVSPWHYALTQCWAIVHYLRLSFWPDPLVLDYGNGLVRQAGDVMPQGLFLIALIAATLLALRNRPALGFAGACFFAILAPSSSFLPLTTQTIAEHRMYLPLAAVITIMVCALSEAAARMGGKLAPFLLGLVLPAAAAGLGFSTTQRTREYRTAVAIWTDTVAKVPKNVRPHDNLANAFLEAGQVQEAVDQYEAALAIDPGDVQAHYNLGNLLLQSGRTDDAIVEYQAALRSVPTFSWARDNLGTALIREGRMSEALDQYTQAVQLDPKHAEAHYNRANLLARAGRIEEAIDEFKTAVQLEPEMTNAHFNLAQALASTGRTQEAIAQYQIVLMLNPGDAEARSDLARLQAASP